MDRKPCESCGKRATFRVLIPEDPTLPMWVYLCDCCTRAKCQYVWDHFELMLNVHPMKEEGGGAFL